MVLSQVNRFIRSDFSLRRASLLHLFAAHYLGGVGLVKIAMGWRIVRLVEGWVGCKVG